MLQYTCDIYSWQNGSYFLLQHSQPIHTHPDSNGPRTNINFGGHHPICHMAPVSAGCRCSCKRTGRKLSRCSGYDWIRVCVGGLLDCAGRTAAATRTYLTDSYGGMKVIGHVVIITAQQLTYDSSDRVVRWNLDKQSFQTGRMSKAVGKRYSCRLSRC
jgi:hypothetical protein